MYDKRFWTSRTTPRRECALDDQDVVAGYPQLSTRPNSGCIARARVSTPRRVTDTS